MSSKNVIEPAFQGKDYREIPKPNLAKRMWPNQYNHKRLDMLQCFGLR